MAKLMMSPTVTDECRVCRCRLFGDDIIALASHVLHGPLLAKTIRKVVDWLLPPLADSGTLLISNCNKGIPGPIDDLVGCRRGTKRAARDINFKPGAANIHVQQNKRMNGPQVNSSLLLVKSAID